MSPESLKLYHSPASPNSRRVRIFLAEKGLKVRLSPPTERVALKRWYEAMSNRPSAAV